MADGHIFEWAISGLFFVFLQTNITFFTTIECNKMSIQYSNQKPSEHEFPSITTRPGLPPYKRKYLPS